MCMHAHVYMTSSFTYGAGVHVYIYIYIYKCILWMDSTFTKEQSRYQRNKENKHTDKPKHGKNGSLRLC